MKDFWEGMKFVVFKYLKRKDRAGCVSNLGLYELRCERSAISANLARYKLFIHWDLDCNEWLWTKSLKVVNITPFDQNQFMTCYLIFNFRPTYFSYFRKITANSISHNVKKEVGPDGPIPVVKGLNNGPP